MMRIPYPFTLLLESVMFGFRCPKMRIVDSENEHDEHGVDSEMEMIQRLEI
jgi:hypothetical protein